MSVPAMTNGSVPMSINRVTTEGASSVCSVDSTRCPVCAACMAIFAVSASRISPSRMTSGSWRRIDRSALAKVSLIFSLICAWLTPGIWYSIGSSIVMMFVFSDCTALSDELSVVVLPLPVVHPRVVLHHFFQQHVEPVTDQHAFLHRLDVDVAGFALDGAFHDQIDQVDDRCRLAPLFQARDRLEHAVFGPSCQRGVAVR